jgi:hypothetical protein
MSLEWHIVSPEQLRTVNRLDTDTGTLEEEVTPTQRCLSTAVTRRNQAAAGTIVLLCGNHAATCWCRCSWSSRTLSC